MSWILDFYRSAMGKKAVMAVTGIILVGFVFGHMAGNLKLYQHDVTVADPHTGQMVTEKKIDVYAEGLREIGHPFFGHSELLWLIRGILILAAALHVLSGVQLTLHNRRARPDRYAMETPQASTWASRTMIWTGLLLLAFITYHLMHLTFGNVHPDFQPGEVFHNVVSGLRVPWVAGFYVLAQLALGLHLYHGVWSLFQTLGWSGPRLDVLRHRLAVAVAVIVTVGNLSFPVAVLSGLVKL